MSFHNRIGLDGSKYGMHIFLILSLPNKALSTHQSNGQCHNAEYGVPEAHRAIVMEASMTSTTMSMRLFIPVLLSQVM